MGNHFRPGDEGFGTSLATPGICERVRGVSGRNAARNPKDSAPLLATPHICERMHGVTGRDAVRNPA
eukprot:1497765-Pyramimonas_sp.AAC.1